MSAMTNTMRETVKDARDAVRETGKATSAASGDIQDDLQALRDDIAKLGREVGDILTNKGNVAYQRAKSSLDGVMSDVGAKGREAAEAVREVSDNLVGAIDDSIQRRPYTTLAIVAGLGFLFGATWRR